MQDTADTVSGDSQLFFSFILFLVFYSLIDFLLILYPPHTFLIALFGHIVKLYESRSKFQANFE